MKIIDFHTHAFPDAVAERVIPMIEKGSIKTKLDGKVSSLLRSMDENGVERAVVCSIATRPEQFGPILKWSKSIASDRLIPFPSIHPADPQAADRVRRILDEGLLGIKIHPYHQEFAIDEARLFPIYGALEETGLIVLCHAGFDFSFARDRRADPLKIARVIEAFPRLKFVAAHLGAWDDWAEVEKHLLGKPVHMDISFSIDMMTRQRAVDFLHAHLAGHLLFGTDSPWAGHAETIQSLLALELDEELNERIFYRNAEALLASVDS